MAYPIYNNNFFTFWGLELLFIIIILFLPIFVSVFDVHTDGYFISEQKGRFFGVLDDHIMFMQGRPLGALTNCFIGWFIYKTEDLTWLRIAAFVFILVSARLIYLICKRENVEILWSYGLAFCFVLLPANILDVLWVASGIPQSLGLLFGVASYFLLDHPKIKPGFFRLVLAGGSFLVGLLMYQSTAMMVFALITIKVFWSSAKSWSSAFKKISYEILFYCFLMLIYWSLVKLMILPLGHKLGLISTTFAIYKMGLVSNISDKMPMMLDTLKYGLMGVWDPLLHHKSFLEFILMVVCLVGGLGIICFHEQKNTLKQYSFTHYIQRILLLSVLFACANAPSFLAVNCREVMGYRTLLPASFMGLLFLTFSIKCFCDVIKNHWGRTFINGLIYLYILSVLLAGSWVINRNVYNNLSFYQYTDSLAQRVDYSTIKKVYLRYSSPVWRAFSLPFEMGNAPIGINFMFDKYASLKGETVQVFEIYNDWPLFFDKHTQVIDFDFLLNKSLVDEKKVYIDPVPVPGSKQKVFIDQNFTQLSKYPVLNFKQVMPGERLVSPWSTGAFARDVFINVHFIGKKESLFAYSYDIDCFDAQGRPSFFDFKWQGLNKPGHWVDITGAVSALGNTRFGQVINSPDFSFLRLEIMKKMSKDSLIVNSMRLISH